jgi:hypothetical protein
MSRTSSSAPNFENIPLFRAASNKMYSGAGTAGLGWGSWACSGGSNPAPAPYLYEAPKSAISRSSVRIWLEGIPKASPMHL